MLEARNVKKYFPRRAAWACSTAEAAAGPFVRAVDDMSLRVRGGFTMGIVGESGCGKTTLRPLHRRPGGSHGRRDRAGRRRAPAGSPSPNADRELKKIQMVFQNPDASLNPQHTVGAERGARPLQLLGKVPAERN